MRIRINETPINSDITTTIKPVDRKDSNAELEKGEIVFDPEKLTLHKVLGKRHSAGGTPVNLNSGTFIFSDFKKLSIKKKEAEEMEFKKGGTPAKVLGKEVNIKHHNAMVEMLMNQKGDEVSTNSAELMLQKNIEKAGQVAFVQENKKSFPNGQPEFSKGTAPVYSRDIDQEIMKSKQYATGGKFATGLNNFFQCPYGRLPNGQCAPAPKGKEAQLAKLQAEILKQAPKNGNYLGDLNNESYYSASNGKTTSTSGPKMTNEQWLEFLRNESPEGKKRRLSKRSITDKFYKVPSSIIPRTPENIPLPVPVPGIPNKIAPPPKTEAGPPPATPDDLPVIGKYPKIGLTDYQKLDLGRQAINALSIKRYDPIRQQQQSYVAQPELFSAQPYLNQINQGYFNASKSLNTLTNPSQLIAGNRELYGNRLDQSNKVIGDIENQNVPLLNDFKNRAAASLGLDAQVNRKFDSDYYDKTINSRVNYNKLKDIAGDNLYNGFNDTMADVQTLQNTVNSQRLLKTDVPVYDKQGNKIGYEGQLPILPKKGFFGWSTQYNQNIAPSAILNYSTGIGAGSPYKTELLNQIKLMSDQYNTETDGRAKAALGSNIVNLYKLLQTK